MKRFAKVIVLILLVVILLPTALNAQSAFEPWSFFTWLLGSVWSRPKNFERPEGAYLTLKLRTPERLVSVLGPTVIVDPTSRLGRMCEAGIKLYTIADNGWTTDADVDFHKSRDTCVEKAAVEVSFNPQTKANGNVTKKLVLWREEFENANGAEVRVYPPKSVASEVVEEWQEVLSHSKTTGDVVILTVTVYVERPTKVKGSQSFQVFVAPATTLAKITNYRDSGMGIALQDADKESKNEIREEKGVSVRVLVKNSSALNETFRPVSLAILDSLGEVYRGEVEDGQEFKVVPEAKSGTIRICQLENEIPLSMYPETLIDKNNCQSGYIRVSEDSELAVYPAGFSGRAKISKGIIKVYAPMGSVLPITFTAKGEGTLNQTVRINNFGGRVISVKTNQPQDEIMVTLKGMTQKITSESQQIVFNMETIGALRSYSTINVNPAKKGGIHSKAQLASYAATSHFRENVAATGVDLKELEIFQRQALEGKAGYTIVGPQTKTFSDNGSQITSVNLIKSLTECGLDGRPIGHKAYYQTTFKYYHRVWVPTGQYGWVPGIISTCGNAVMVYMAPPNKKNYPLRLAIAPPPEESMKVSWDNLLLSVANIKQGSLVITPSSIAPYIPQTQAQINIKNSQSQSQGQNQHQSQGQTQNQNSTNTNTNVNNNTNINNNTIDVNNTNNNINQNQTILNNANANN